MRALIPIYWQPMAFKGPTVLARDFGELDAWPGLPSSQRTRSTVDTSATSESIKGKAAERLTTETL